MINGVGFVDFSVLIKLVKESRISTVVVTEPLVTKFCQTRSFIEGIGQFLHQYFWRYKRVGIQARAIVVASGGVVVAGLRIGTPFLCVEREGEKSKGDSR